VAPTSCAASLRVWDPDGPDAVEGGRQPGRGLAELSVVHKREFRDDLGATWCVGGRAKS
jgi:hypothetical protein